MYLLKLPFSTVVASPVRSYATPSRGTTLRKVFTSVFGVCRSGTHTPAGENCSAIQMNVSSKRAPTLIVRRLRDHPPVLNVESDLPDAVVRLDWRIQQIRRIGHAAAEPKVDVAVIGPLGDVAAPVVLRAGNELMTSEPVV